MSELHFDPEEILFPALLSLRPCLQTRSLFLHEELSPFLHAREVLQPVPIPIDVADGGDENFICLSNASSFEPLP